jgi:hypothetical protein
MTLKELKEFVDSVPELPDEMPVRVIFDGEIDYSPTVNVCEDAIYIEGVRQ